MHPTLVALDLGGHHAVVGSYGVCLAAAFLVGAWVTLRRAARAGADVDAVRDLLFWSLVGALAGARALFVAVHAAEFAAACDAAPRECLRPLALWEGGLVYVGGLAGGLGTALTVARRRHLTLAPLMDLMAPALALGHAVGRVGCFFAGCCWGRPTSLPWGLRFPPPSAAWAELAQPAAPSTPPLHPTQLYEALGELLLYFALTRLRSARAGVVAAAYFAGYALLRLAIEPLRGDPGRGQWGPLTPSQWHALVALPVVAAWLARSRFSRR